MEERVFQKTVRNVVGRLKNWGRPSENLAQSDVITV